VDVPAAIDRSHTGAKDAGVVDLSALSLGRWCNTHGGFASLARVDLGGAGAGLTARLFWMGDPVPTGSDEVEITHTYADAPDSRKAIAFATHHRFGPVLCNLQASMTQGLMVAAAFVRFPQASSRTDYFTRAFLYLQEASGGEDVRTAEAPGSTSAVVHPLYPPAHVSQLAGTWINTNRASTGIVKYVVDACGRHVVSRAFEAGRPSPVDWGEVAGHVYAKGNEAQEPMIFTASYETGDRVIDIQAKLNQGLLVVAHFYRYPRGDRSNYYAREFYYKV
jgi:hypothetical protein